MVALTGRNEFRRVLDQGGRRRVGGIVMVSARGIEEVARVGLIAGRRMGNAVDRNRAKRRIRHAVRAVSLESGRDYVVIASTTVLDVPFRKLIAWLSAAADSKE